MMRRSLPPLRESLLFARLDGHHYVQALDDHFSLPCHENLHDRSGNVCLEAPPLMCLEEAASTYVEDARSSTDRPMLVYDQEPA